VGEDELGIPALYHSKLPSDTIGNILSGAWDESKLRFHHFDFLTCVPKSTTGYNILMEQATHSTISGGDSEPLLVFLEPHTIVWECHLRADEDEVYGSICVER